MEPEYSDEEIFMTLLDHRYPEVNGTGLRRKMFDRKNEIKKAIKLEIEEGISIFDKFTLPVLIYTCLLIEENNYLNPQKAPYELLDPITAEVKRQGFEKYC